MVLRDIRARFHNECRGQLINCGSTLKTQQALEAMLTTPAGTAGCRFSISPFDKGSIPEIRRRDGREHTHGARATRQRYEVNR